MKIAWTSAQNPHQEFYSLMHHVNVGTLRSCYDKLDGRKAVGVDMVTKEQYGENLRANLEDLIKRMKEHGIPPGAVRQVLIPKEGKPGATRPLGISNFEDKLVQKNIKKFSRAYTNQYSCHAPTDSGEGWDVTMRSEI